MADKTNQAFDPKEFLAKVGEGKTILEFSKDEVVFAQGDVAATVFYIQKGGVKVVVISEQGKEAVVGILEPGQFFGEGCMNGHSLRIATTTAMEDRLVTAITRVAMLAALHSIQARFLRVVRTQYLAPAFGPKAGMPKAARRNVCRSTKWRPETSGLFLF